MTKWVEKKVIRLRDWLWPEEWPLQFRNFLTGALIVTLIYLPFLIAFLLA